MSFESEGFTMHNGDEVGNSDIFLFGSKTWKRNVVNQGFVGKILS